AHRLGDVRVADRRTDVRRREAGEELRLADRRVAEKPPAGEPADADAEGAAVRGHGRHDAWVVRSRGGVCDGLAGGDREAEEEVRVVRDVRAYVRGVGGG